jgi:hypothetical protein
MPLGWKAGGRKVGTPNATTARLRELVEDAAGGPLPVLLAKAGRQAYDGGDVALAVAAWAKAAVLVYARPTYEPPPYVPPVVIIDDIPRIDGGGVRIKIPPPDGPTP